MVGAERQGFAAGAGSRAKARCNGNMNIGWGIRPEDRRGGRFPNSLGRGL
ncbi:hypothetical protein NDI45_18825 [Leptolyngbya sp. GB1-A1]